MYRTEIWEWKEQEVERVQEKYLRWGLGVEKETPGHNIVREECKRSKLRVKAGRERQSPRTKWAKGKSAGYCLSAIEKIKRTRMRRRERSTTGGAGMIVERMRAEGRGICAELSERDKDTDKQERRERIRESRYNREYERCMTEEIFFLIYL
ncbi:hypothetical protein MTP99_015811 [Tenebrio molitor]|nr:hypothetical protein MTP99_015811 [Tenebrio molitor]